MKNVVSEITEGIKVTVSTEYQPNYSSPSQAHYVFTYKVIIDNHGDYTVQLTHRNWFIHDANGSMREVSGEGVVGQQPILEPGDTYEYVSGSNLKSGMGKMVGVYNLERIVDGKKFSVKIPEFTLIVPFKLN